MTNLLQLNLSSYILHYGLQSLNSIVGPPPQMRANENFGFVLPDPPVYSEATFLEPPPYPQSPPFPPPPPYPCSLSTSSLPPFSELIDYSQPPPYSE
ncbi:uncharacterized protein [Eleutherodactylus coqui]|uniref:uncharacterized protein n=1 Tax=Eleutherodactylus coqui TaxID=57060 RepID=UPI003462DF41